PMRVLVTGSTGLVGTALIEALNKVNAEVVRLVRKPGSHPEEQILWEPAKGTIDAGGLEGLDAVIHLAGESVAEGRWSEAKKARIRDSRVEGTTVLCEALAALKRPPKVLVSASAIGYYGDRGDEAVDETGE